MRGTRPTRFGLGALAAYVVVVAALTAATTARIVGTDLFASSPRRLAGARFWSLFTSALVCDHPLAASLGALAGFGVVTLVVCGPRLLWTAAALGHVFSTLCVYAMIASVRLADRSAFDTVLDKRDLGISAVCAAWLGAVAATLWRRPRLAARAKAGVALACVLVGVLAWLVRPDLTALDTDHLFAFAIGVAVATVPLRRLVHADAVYAFTATAATRMRLAFVGACRAALMWVVPQQRA